MPCSETAFAPARREGADPSEATEEVLELQLGRFEAPGADEDVIDVDMSAELTAERIDALADRVLA